MGRRKKYKTEEQDAKLNVSGVGNTIGATRRKLMKRLREDIERKRKCPKCGTEITYSSKYRFERAILENRHCNSGCRKKGIKLSEETKRKMSENSPKYWATHKFPESAKLKISNTIRLSGARIGKRNSFYGKHHTEKTKQKLRSALLLRVANGTPLGVGKNEKRLLDEQEKKIGKPIMRQFPIPGLGFIADGYCPATNTIYEVYEQRHDTPKNRKKDGYRQKLIVEKLKCNFEIIWDKN